LFQEEKAKMIPNWPIALKSLASIQTAMELTPPDWLAALKIFEDQVDFATHPIFQRLEPGQAPPTVDSRIGEVRVEIERLQQALKARNRPMVDNLLRSAVRKVKTLDAEAAVA
jgi:hypothetical protein